MSKNSLEDFAKKCGVSLVKCDPMWGGTYGYTTDDFHNVTINGFRSKREAYQDWLSSSFGERAGKALMEILESLEQPEKNEYKTNKTASNTTLRMQSNVVYDNSAYFKYRGCQRKKKYRSEDEAEAAVKATKNKDIHHYECSFCKNWHIGHKLSKEIHNESD